MSFTTNLASIDRAPQRHKSRTRMMTLIAVFAAISTVLMFFEFPLPFMPPFLKLDISGVPALIMAFLYGPGPAIYVTLIKDMVHLLTTTTGGVGQVADFLVMASFSSVVGLIYRHRKDKKSVALAFIAGILTITFVGALANKFLLIPFFSTIMPIDAIVSACQALNPMIDSIDAYILFGAAPFNMIKGVILSILTFLLYKRLSGFIKNRVGD